MSQVELLSTTYPIDTPNICPFCHITQQPKIVVSRASRNMSITYSKVDYTIYEALAIWECVNKSCLKSFVCHYLPSDDSRKFSLNRFLNGLPKGPDWPKPIEDLKSANPRIEDVEEQTRFIKTYLQSLVAENSGLDEIAGMGYRKSIEYLVKDWAIQNNPQEKAKIEKLWLGHVIDKYYSGDLKNILDRATWLGNDQAHYLKLFDDYSIDDLKELIALIMVELDRQYKLQHYITNIQGRK